MGEPDVTADEAAPTSPAAPAQPLLSEQRVRAAAPRAIAVLAALAVTVPILASTFLALRDGWIPTADVALMALRSDDVIGGELPLLGIHSRGSQFGSDVPVYHPGPLPFWVLAPFVEVTGSSVTGLVVGTAVVNLATVLLLLWVANRRGGTALVAAIGIGLGVMLWALRGEVLHDPWTPHLALLPFTLLVLLAWSVAIGDRRLLPLLVAAASFVVQNHVTYLPVVAGLSAWAVAGLAFGTRWDERALPPEARRAERRDLLRWAGIAAGVGLVCWSAPIVEQIWGDGNLGALLRVAQADDVEKLGLADGIGRVLGGLGAVPIWLSHSDHISRVVRPSTFADLAIAWATLAAAVGLLVEAWRRRDRVAVTMLATALVGVGSGVLLVARAPRFTQAIEFYWYRWLWPVGMFLWLSVIWAALRLFVRDRLDDRARLAGRGLGAATLAVLVVVGLLQPPLREDRDGVRYDELAALSDQAGEVLHGTGPYLVQTDGTMFWHKSTVASGLEERGVRVVVEPDDLPWGDRRTYTPGDAVAGRLLVTGGPQGRIGPEGARLVAFVPIQAESEPDLAERIRSLLASGPVTVRADARRLLQRLVDGDTPEQIRASESSDRWPPELHGIFESLVLAHQASRPTSSDEPIQLDPAPMDEAGLLSIVRWGWLTRDSLPPEIWTVAEDPLVEDGYARSPDSGMAVFLLPPP